MKLPSIQSLLFLAIMTIMVAGQPTEDDVPGAGLLKQLTGLGFARPLAQAAVQQASTEPAAISWMLSHAHDYSKFSGFSFNDVGGGETTTAAPTASAPAPPLVLRAVVRPAPPAKSG